MLHEFFIRELLSCVQNTLFTITKISANRSGHRNRADLIESATPCYDAQVVGSYRV